MTHETKASRARLGLGLLLVFAVFAGALVVYRPDRPVANLEPGSSDGPNFVVQVIRPRLGLPLGGILPPQIFGLDAELGFDAASPGATVGRVDDERIELSAEGWDLVLVRDAEGRVTTATEVAFELLFEENPKRVRCQPREPVVGTFTTVLLDSGELAGSFHLELPRCVDAITNKPLGWPTKPLVLHGSFDRLPVRAAPAPR